MTSDKLHDQTHQKCKLKEENKNLRHLLKNAETQLTALCAAQEQQNSQKRKSVFILERLEDFGFRSSYS